MEQLMLFDYPYKYLIDSCSLMAQKTDEDLPRQVHKSLWKMIDKCIEEQLIITSSEIEEEISKDDIIGDWFRNTHCVVIQIDDEIQTNVRRIVTEHPGLIKFSGSKGSSSGDAFLIATAMKFKISIITEENKTKMNSIPNICAYYGINTFSITELCKKEGWFF